MYVKQVGNEHFVLDEYDLQIAGPFSSNASAWECIDRLQGERRFKGPKPLKSKGRKLQRKLQRKRAHEQHRHAMQRRIK